MRSSCSSRVRARTYVRGATVTAVLFALLAGCSSTASDGGFTKACGAGVDAYSAALNDPNGTDAEAARLGRASLEACPTATGWEVAAKIDHIPFGNTDVHDVLGALCHDEDSQRATKPCQDSIIKDLSG